MDSKEIRQKFIEFFKKNGHEIVPSSSLIPEDSSVLFTTAGMQQFKKYYSGSQYSFKNPDSVGVVSVQKCFRTSDIDEVGDDSHLTFFQMLGNFSFGLSGQGLPGYFKEEAIKFANEFITKEMGLKIDYVGIFAGDEIVPADTESERIWKSLGVSDIRKLGREDNFWGPTGSEGPCGPTSEIYVNGVEIWNLVFNEYYQHADKSLKPLKQNGIDTGMGFERLVVMVQKKKNIFETDLFVPIMLELDKISDERKKRIIADHARSIVFLISDCIRPSNKEAGYILRRLMRRTMIYADGIDIKYLLSKIVGLYSDFYKELNNDVVLEVFEKENTQFSNTLMHERNGKNAEY
jgi:alanyl-tRNA synthetase